MADPDTALHALLRVRRGHASSAAAPYREAHLAEIRAEHGRRARSCWRAPSATRRQRRRRIVFNGRRAREHDGARSRGRDPYVEGGPGRNVARRALERGWLVTTASGREWSRLATPRQAAGAAAGRVSSTQHGVPADPPAPAARHRALRGLVRETRAEPRGLRLPDVRRRTASTVASRSRRCPGSTACRSPHAVAEAGEARARWASRRCCCSGSPPPRTRRAPAPGTTRASSSSPPARSRRPTRSCS